jgi:hypothetical protein
VQQENIITASCVFSNDIIYKNELPIFENRGPDLPGFLLSVYQHLGIQYPKFYKMDNLSKLGLLAAEVLLKDSFINKIYPPEQTGIILCNNNASLDTDIKYFETVKHIASPALFVYTLPNIMIGEISIRHGFKGENSFFIFEQFDAKFIEEYVNSLFNNNNLQACICGWVEVLGNAYKAVLYLVEKATEGAQFTKENINKIYSIENG